MADRNRLDEFRVRPRHRRMELRAGAGQGRRRAGDRAASCHQPGAAACCAQRMPAVRAARRIARRRRRSARSERHDDDHHVGRVLCGADLGRRSHRVGRWRRGRVRIAADRRLAVAVRHLAARRNGDGAGSAAVRRSARHSRGDADAGPTRAALDMMLVLDRRAAGGAWSRTRSQAGDEAGRVEIWEVSVSFRQGSTVNHALENTSVDIAPGSFVCLLGPSGCGKSTLLNTVAGYVRPTTGWARVDGVQVLGPGSDRGMVFQQYSLFPWKTLRDNVAFGPYATGSGRALPRPRSREVTTDAEFIALKRHFLQVIRAESLKAFEDQDR